MRRIRAWCAVLALVAPALVSGARAADDEILVTDGDLAKPGEPELEVHTNYSRGSRESPGSGVFAPDGVLRVTPELSIGLSEHWDAGVYLPLSWVPGNGWYYDGIRLRAKVIEPRALSEDAQWYYGAQFELANQRPGVSPDQTSVEAKLVAGFEAGHWEGGINLLVQRDMPDPDLWSPAYGLNLRLARRLPGEVAVGLEHYAAWSSTDRQTPIRGVDHISFATVSWKQRGWNLHLGVGHGWAASPDRTVVKLVIGVPLD